MEEIKGTVERVNPKGLKIDGRWYNFSKFMEDEIPEINEGDEIKVDIKGDWIMKFKLLSRQPFETWDKNGTSDGRVTNNWTKDMDMRGMKEVERQVVITRLACLNTATEILKSHIKPVTSKNLFKVAEELEKWVWRNFREEVRENTQDSEENAAEEFDAPKSNQKEGFTNEQKKAYGNN